MCANGNHCAAAAAAANDGADAYFSRSAACCTPYVCGIIGSNLFVGLYVAAL